MPLSSLPDNPPPPIPHGDDGSGSSTSISSTQTDLSSGTSPSSSSTNYYNNNNGNNSNEGVQSSDYNTNQETSSSGGATSSASGGATSASGGAIHQSSDPPSGTITSALFVLGVVLLSAGYFFAVFRPRRRLRKKYHDMDTSLQSTSSAYALNTSLPRYAYYTDSHNAPSNIPVSSVGSTAAPSNRRRTIMPSFHHPGIAQLPHRGLLLETQKRLVERGVRLFAHGMNDPARPVWIRADQEALIWQKEYSKSYDSGVHAGQVPLRGSSHRILWKQLIFIDLGKKTLPLRSLAKSATWTCFSVLTHHGSLDLQAKSELERDAVVCCLSMILDQHKGDGWRRLHDPDDDSSSSTATPPAMFSIMSSTED